MLDSLKSPEQKQLDLMAVHQSETKKVAKDLDGKIKALGDANTLTLDKADNVKMTYTAKNTFGALILENVTTKADYKSETISIISQNN